MPSPHYTLLEFTQEEWWAGNVCKKPLNLKNVSWFYFHLAQITDSFASISKK
jgi:hypothetical protein